MLFVCAAAWASVEPAAAQSLVAAQSSGAAVKRSGADIYQDACAACHGADGRGLPQSTVGFDVPLPDFSDCLFATVEADEGWEAVVHEGGPVRALDRHMPAFGQLLSREEIRMAVGHVRTFCKDRRSWPQGDLNFPRALITEKAFPENETLVTTSIGAGPAHGVSNELLYERRFGARNMFEVNIPFDAQQTSTGQWVRGLGDVAIAVKRAIYHDAERGTIFSLGEEVALPTGKQTEGLGTGSTIFETFAAFGQRLPRESFVQVHTGIALPTGDDVEKEAFWRGAIGRTFVQGGFHRSWSPMLEVVAARAVEGGARTEWDVVPQMEVSLSKRRHVLVSGGVQIPISERGDRHPRVLTYFLWDWYEGGLFDGWR